ncbi:MAG: hypothetical protein K2Y56_00705 [Methylobacterium sp.]|uniref:hypothetical protein n=1 Tax=Methylobacterium sp. TaxID=409 RepID=UPI0026010983|nr:hypothetical protein [Methylobacterium sp.]MBX9930057.1 hypothetical protein [Methylobacterium sp.]
MAVGAHVNYINALAKFEFLAFQAEIKNDAALEYDLKEAEYCLSNCRRVLEILIEVLGYVPKTFTAKLPPEPTSE